MKFYSVEIVDQFHRHLHTIQLTEDIYSKLISGYPGVKRIFFPSRPVDGNMSDGYLCEYLYDSHEKTFLLICQSDRPLLLSDIKDWKTYVKQSAAIHKARLQIEELDLYVARCEHTSQAMEMSRFVSETAM